MYAGADVAFAISIRQTAGYEYWFIGWKIGHGILTWKSDIKYISHSYWFLDDGFGQNYLSPYINFQILKIPEIAQPFQIIITDPQKGFLFPSHINFFAKELEIPFECGVNRF